MAQPNSRKTLKEYCLRKLGAPVIQINVDYDQIEDCIDDAIQMFENFHMDGTKRIYLKHLVTATDVTNKYIPVPEQVIYVKQLLPFNTSALGVGSGLFDAKYQIHMNDIYNLNGFVGSLSYYKQIGQYLETLDMVLTGVPQISFQRYENRIYIHGEWWDNEIKEGDYLVAEVYQTVDVAGIYNNAFLKEYTTALIKEIWGRNLSKFEGVQLPGGVTLNGREILSEAREDLERIKEQMRLGSEMPVDFFIG